MDDMQRFQARVLELVSKIPKGKVTTYKEIALALKKPLAYRAVANALAKNPRPVEIPCHRVVKSNGEVGSYKRGARQKIKLLLFEGVEVKNKKVDLVKYSFRFKSGG